MSEPRDFDAEYDWSNRAGLTFKLGGHVFTTKPVAPVKAFMTSGKSGLDVAMDFFKAILVPDVVPIFMEMIESDTVLISAKQIDSIAAWLMGELSGNPTESPASSGNGENATSSTSAGGSLLEVPTGG